METDQERVMNVIQVMFYSFPYLCCFSDTTVDKVRSQLGDIQLAT